MNQTEAPVNHVVGLQCQAFTETGHCPGPLRCRIEPFLDQGGASRRRWRARRRALRWDARPARARRAAQQPQINPALGADRATGLIRPVSHTSFGREGSAVHPQMPRPKLPVPGPAQERVTCHRPHFWPTGCHPCPQTEQVGPFFFLPNMVTYTPPVRTTGSACPKCCVLDGGGEPWGLTGAISGPLTPVAGSLPSHSRTPRPAGQAMRQARTVQIPKLTSNT